MVNYDENDKTGYDIIPGSEKLKELFNSTRNSKYEWSKMVEELLDMLIYSAPDNKLEIKTESYNLVKRTGNALIEISTKYNGKEYFEDSGYSLTDADYYVLAFKNEFNELLDIPIVNYSLNYLDNVIDKYNLKPIDSTEPTENGDIIRGYRVPLYLLLEPLLMCCSLEDLDHLRELKVKDLERVEKEKINRLREINRIRNERLKEKN